MSPKPKDVFVANSESLEAGSILDEKSGTGNERRDMRRMGKKPEVRRNFAFMPMVGFAVILGNTWEWALISTVVTLGNGGTAGAVWMFLAVVFGMFFVMLSMAEMASMAPTAGGQFFWVSEFAPRQYQKVLSYTVGWFCVLGWQSALVLTAYSVAQQVEALISLCDVDYTIRGWQGTLLTMPITLFAIMLNTLLARRLPILQNIAFALHTAGFFVLIAVFWALGPHNDPAIVLSDFSETTGWSSVGLACLVSLVGPINTLVGADSSCHLSEELVNASYVLPRAMLTTAIINYTMGFVMTITLMLNLGDVATALASPTGQPYVQVLLDVTGSKGAAITLTALVCVLLLVCTVNGVTTSSRQLFAFARDRGLPFSDFLGQASLLASIWFASFSQRESGPAGISR